MKKQTSLIIITLILVVSLLVIMNFKKSENGNVAPSLPGEVETELYSYYVVEDDLEPLTSANIIGDWKAISEQAGMDGVVTNNPENYSISFTEDGIYFSSVYGISDSGFYEVRDGKIYFYNSKEDIGKEGNFLTAQGGIRDGDLRVVFPQFPKEVVYEKI